MPTNENLLDRLPAGEYTMTKLEDGRLEIYAKGNISVYCETAKGEKIYREVNKFGSETLYIYTDPPYTDPPYKVETEHYENGGVKHYKDSTGYESWHSTTGSLITKEEYDTLEFVRNLRENK